jgi:hypothetical protein
VTLNHAWAILASDKRVWIALALVGVDFILGVLAAAKSGTFNLSRIAKFAETDFAFKLIPWAVLFIGAQFAGGTLDVVEKAVYAGIVAAWAGSILSSLSQLGIAPQQAIAGPENPPGPPAPPAPPQ